MRFSKGFTLIELMIVLAIAGIATVVFGGIGMSAYGSISGANASKATEAATAYSVAMFGSQPAGVMCSNSDSDSDGYVSCDVKLPDGSIEQLQCPAWGSFFNDGCKSFRLMQNMNTTRR